MFIGIPVESRHCSILLAVPCLLQPLKLCEFDPHYFPS